MEERPLPLRLVLLLLLLLLWISLCSSLPLEKEVWAAIRGGRTLHLKGLLLANPSWNLSTQDESGDTALHLACHHERGDLLLSILLAHPDIDVNLEGHLGLTPFLASIEDLNSGCFRRLLRDPRVRLSSGTNTTTTTTSTGNGGRVSPLSLAALRSHIGVVIELITSGRELQVTDADFQAAGWVEPAKVENGMTGKLVDNQGAEERNRRRADIFTLLAWFKSNPADVRRFLRGRFGLTGKIPSLPLRDLRVSSMPWLFSVELVLRPPPELGEEGFHELLTQIPLQPQDMWLAVYDLDFESVKVLLKTARYLDINWQAENFHMNETALHSVCRSHHTSLLPLLLAHPDIDINVRDTTGATPLYLACKLDNYEHVRLLLQDPRVMVNTPDHEGRTPFLAAVSSLNLNTLRWLIASGREYNLGEQQETFPKRGVVIGNESQRKGISTLVEQFRKNPAQTTAQVRKDLGITGEALSTPEISFVASANSLS